MSRRNVQCTVYNFHQKAFLKNVLELYKMTVSTKQCALKSLKADRKLIRLLINAATAGRTVEMDNHET